MAADAIIDVPLEIAVAFDNVGVLDEHHRAVETIVAHAQIRSGEARDATTAAQLAQAKMEEIAADKSSPARGFDYLDTANYPPENPVVAFPRFRRSVNVSADSTFDGVRFRAVNVTVSTASIPPVTLTTWFAGH